MRIIGIDPGAISGAYAVLDDDSIFVDDLPTVAGQVNAALFYRILKTLACDVAVIENVGSRPGQGVSSVWKFGFACGTIHGVAACCQVPVTMVAPTVWKKHFGLIGRDKDYARQVAIRLYPGLPGLERKKDCGRADALLMALYFSETAQRVKPEDRVHMA